MSLDSRLRLARKNGTGANLKHFEVPTMVEALELLRACERAEAKGPLPAPPFPAFIARDLVEAELQAMLETCRERITDLGGDCDPVDRMLEGAMHMLDMRVQGKARDQANPVDPRAAAARSSDIAALLDDPVIAAAVRVPGEEVALASAWIWTPTDMADRLDNIGNLDDDDAATLTRIAGYLRGIAPGGAA